MHKYTCFYSFAEYDHFSNQYIIGGEKMQLQVIGENNATYLLFYKMVVTMFSNFQEFFFFADFSYTEFVHETSHIQPFTYD